ncbi:MAG: PEP-CTERM sorting domain-containing protein, partial [Pirellula sp.]
NDQYPWGSGGSGLKRAKLYYLNIQGSSWDFDNNVDDSSNVWTEITSVYTDGDFTQNNTPTSHAQVRSFTEVQARAFKFVLLEGFGVDSMVKTDEDNDGNAIREAQKIILMGELAFFQSGGPSPPPPPPGPVPEPSTLLVLVGLSSLTIGRNWISKRKR